VPDGAAIANEFERGAQRQLAATGETTREIADARS
jgi:hypothetical protein